MNGDATGKLTLLEAPEGENGEALINYLAKYQKSASREKLEEMIRSLPLVLGKNVPEHVAQRITTDLEGFGAKLRYSPASFQEKTVQTSPAGVDVPLKSLREALLSDSFNGEKIRFPISPLYRAGLLLVTIAMIFLPVVYIGIIAGAGYLLLWHATANVAMFSTMNSAKAALFCYVTPLVVGALLIFFLIKPLFARRTGTHKFYEVSSSEEPLLYAFIEKVCVTIGAPKPSRVRIDTQVNASAGFRRGILSFSGRDLVLTIGLPLAGGLNIEEFAGVLAHEFGHFAQASGMRLTYIIRSINYWFSRVVYDEDAWDERLRTWTRDLDFRIAIILWIARFFIWVGKKVLLVLMKAGHFISCFMLRQMEFDADRYEAAMVGADVFESTCDKLAFLSVAHSWAFEDLGRAWEEGRLADNLPELVMVNLRQMKDETKSEISNDRTLGKTRVFDTHPADRDRIASARSVSRVPVFSWLTGCRVEMPGAIRTDTDGIPADEGVTPPATVLFKDFSALSKKVTLDHYCRELGLAPEQKDLVDVNAMVQSLDEEQRYFASLERFFLGRFNPWFPLGINARRLFAPADTGEALRMISELRDGILRRDSEPDELQQQYFRLWERITQAANARALLEGGFTINHKDFNLPGSGYGDVDTAEQRYSEREKQLLDEIGAIISLYRDRMILGLQLLQVPSVAGQTGDGVGKLREIDTFLEALDALEDQVPLLRKLDLDFQRLAVLTRQIANNESNERLIKSIHQWMDTVRQDLGFLRQGLGNTAYPFGHAQAEMTLGLFIVNPNFEDCELGELLDIAETAIDRMPRICSKLAARLALAAEEVETIHGLPPLK
jgi:Zn-dependent protease with chaperone function